MIRRLSRGLVYGIGAIVMSGCYTYVPVENPAPRTPVRVTVPVNNSVSGVNRAPQNYTLEGTVVSLGDSLTLETETTADMGQFRQVTRVDTVRVARQNLLALDERVYSQSRTIGLSAVIVAGTAALVAGIYSATVGFGGDGGNGGGSTTNQISVEPVFRGLLQFVGVLR